MQPGVFLPLQCASVGSKRFKEKDCKILLRPLVKLEDRKLFTFYLLSCFATSRPIDRLRNPMLEDRKLFTFYLLSCFVTSRPIDRLRNPRLKDRKLSVIFSCFAAPRQARASAILFYFHFPECGNEVLTPINSTLIHTKTRPGIRDGLHRIVSTGYNPNSFLISSTASSFSQPKYSISRSVSRPFSQTFSTAV